MKKLLINLMNLIIYIAVIWICLLDCTRNGLVLGSVSSVNIAIPSSGPKFPKYECMTQTPANQKYYPTMYTIDSDFYEFCQIENSEKVPKAFWALDQVPTCSEFFCQSDKIWNFRNSTQQVLFGFMLNHCLYCENNDTMTTEFRNAVRNGTCSAMVLPSGLNFVDAFYGVAAVHCNLNDLKDSNSFMNFPLVDYNLFLSEYFMNDFAKYRRQVLLEKIPESYKDALNNVTLNSLVKYYFRDYSDYSYANLTQVIKSPTDLPLLCWCRYQQNSGQSFGYQCNDFYQNGYNSFIYHISAIFFSIIFSFYCYGIVIFIIVPRIYERFSSFKQRTDIKMTASIPKKIVMTLRHFLDIVTHPPVFFALGSLCGFLENFARNIFNFSATNPFYQVYFFGIFRALSCALLLCGYSSLVISWAHVIDQSKRKAVVEEGKKGKEIKLRRGLSVFNLSVLIIFYVAVVIVIIISLGMFVIFQNDTTAWILMAAAILFYLLTFVAGFSFYGIKILVTMRKTTNFGSLMEYRFTKFIMAETCLFFIVWLICFLMLLTYMFGFDFLSLFYGLSRTLIGDASLVAMLVLSSYITFNEPVFAQLYGWRALNIWKIVTTCGYEIYSKKKEANEQLKVKVEDLKQPKVVEDKNDNLPNDTILNSTENSKSDNVPNQVIDNIPEDSQPVTSQQLSSV